MIILSQWSEYFAHFPSHADICVYEDNTCGTTWKQLSEDSIGSDRSPVFPAFPVLRLCDLARREYCIFVVLELNMNVCDSGSLSKRVRCCCLPFVCVCETKYNWAFHQTIRRFDFRKNGDQSYKTCCQTSLWATLCGQFHEKHDFKHDSLQDTGTHNRVSVLVIYFFHQMQLRNCPFWQFCGCGCGPGRPVLTCFCY